MRVLCKFDAIGEQKTNEKLSRELVENFGPINTKRDCKRKGRNFKTVKPKKDKGTIWDGIELVEKLIAENKPELAMIKLNMIAWDSVELSDIDNALHNIVSGELVC